MQIWIGRSMPLTLPCLYGPRYLPEKRKEKKIRGQPADGDLSIATHIYVPIVKIIYRYHNRCLATKSVNKNCSADDGTERAKSQNNESLKFWCRYVGRYRPSIRRYYLPEFIL